MFYKRFINKLMILNIDIINMDTRIKSDFRHDVDDGFGCFT